MSDWLANLAGRFIVFDGPDGSGKSTQLARFARHCREGGLTLCEVREPGGTEIGEQIRRVLLDPANTEMSLRCEMLLYMASRAQLVEQIIRPALSRGELVLADRFISSTLAYQGTAGGLPSSQIMAVGTVAVGESWPDLTVIFDVDEATASRRMAGKSAARRAGPQTEHSLFSDRLERKGLEFQKRVREGYLAQAQEQPQKYLVVDGGREEAAVFAALLDGLREWFP